jgi:hypothetical protein
LGDSTCDGQDRAQLQIRQVSGFLPYKGATISVCPAEGA